MIYYKLDKNNNPISCTREEAFEFSNSLTSRIKQDYIIKDKIRISTIFLSLSSDSSYLFETMIFIESKDLLEKYDNWNHYMMRYKTYTEALIGHDKIKFYLKRLIEKDEK